jgi:3-hydroxyisobutyrate dehydrogenase-like beta-hydroxyacid dehydrogenase
MSTLGLGFIGVGAMGQGMCRNLAAKSGRQVHAADLDPENLRRLEDAGVKAASIGAMREQVDTVFLSLPSIQQVEDVCFGAEPLVRAGSRVKTIIDMSTSDVARTRALAARLAEHGIEFLDAPVARSREAANNGTLLITVGGPQALFDRVLPLLRCMGSDVVRCGDTGTGQVVKIMNNMVLLSTVNAIGEAMAIASGAGVDRTLLTQVLRLGSADSFALKLVGERMAQDSFPEKLFPASYALKDLKLALDLAAGGGVQPHLATATAGLLSQAVDRGWGAAYYPVIYRLIAR